MLFIWNLELGIYWGCLTVCNLAMSSNWPDLVKTSDGNLAANKSIKKCLFAIAIARILFKTWIKMEAFLQASADHALSSFLEHCRNLGTKIKRVDYQSMIRVINGVRKLFPKDYKSLWITRWFVTICQWISPFCASFEIDSHNLWPTKLFRYQHLFVRKSSQMHTKLPVVYPFL